jgi:hypothetical protein
VSALTGSPSAIVAEPEGDDSDRLPGGLVHVRAILGNIGVLVIPQQVEIARAHEAFDDTGNLKDAKQRAAVESVGAALARTVAKLRA